MPSTSSPLAATHSAASLGGLRARRAQSLMPQLSADALNTTASTALPTAPDAPLHLPRIRGACAFGSPAAPTTARGSRRTSLGTSRHGDTHAATSRPTTSEAFSPVCSLPPLVPLSTSSGGHADCYAAMPAWEPTPAERSDLACTANEYSRTSSYAAAPRPLQARGSSRSLASRSRSSVQPRLANALPARPRCRQGSISIASDGLSGSSDDSTPVPSPPPVPQPASRRRPSGSLVIDTDLGAMFASLELGANTSSQLPAAPVGSSSSGEATPAVPSDCDNAASPASPMGGRCRVAHVVHDSDTGAVVGINQYELLDQRAHGLQLAQTFEQPGRLFAVDAVPRALAKGRLACLDGELKHDSIVQIYEAIDDPKEDAVYLVMEFVDGSRVGVASSDADGTFACARRDDRVQRLIASSVARALLHCHAQELSHGAVDPAHVLLERSSPRSVRICRVKLSAPRGGYTRATDSADLQRDAHALGQLLFCVRHGCWPDTGNAALVDASDDSEMPAIITALLAAKNSEDKKKNNDVTATLATLRAAAALSECAA